MQEDPTDKQSAIEILEEAQARFEDASREVLTGLRMARYAVTDIHPAPDPAD